MITLQSADGVKTPHTLTHIMELRPYIEEPLSNDEASLSFMSHDLRPRIRHDFILSNRYAVDEYWLTLEYCYAAANKKAALYAFPGSVVHEVILFSFHALCQIPVLHFILRSQLQTKLKDVFLFF